MMNLLSKRLGFGTPLINEGVQRLFTVIASEPCPPGLQIGRRGSERSNLNTRLLRRQNRKQRPPRNDEGCGTSRNDREQARQPRNFMGGQVAIEGAIAVVAIILFLLGVTQLFLWMNRSIITRQRNYQATRTQLGGGNLGWGGPATADSSINFYDALSDENRLYVWEEENPN